MPDLPALARPELEQLRADVLGELERRDRLEAAPQLIATGARRFVEDGGDLAAIRAALDALEVTP